jgi:tetratricopeptide (TPR) repeat protein
MKRESDKPIAMSEASFGRRFPDELERIVSKLLETNPANRYQNAKSLSTDLVKIKSISSETSNPERQQPSTENVSAERNRLPRNWKTTTAISILVALSVVTAAVIAAKRKHTVASQQPVPDTIPLGNDIKLASEISWLNAIPILQNAQEFKREGKYEQALANYKKALAIYERQRVPIDPDIADTLSEMVDCYLLQGKYSEADVCLQKALAIYTKLYEPGSRHLASNLNSLGIRFLSLKSVDVNKSWQIAQPLFLKAEHLCTITYGANGIETILTLAAQADTCLSRGLIREAKWRCDKALFSLRDPSARVPRDYVRVASIAAKVYCQTGDQEKLLRLSQDIVSFYELTAATNRAGMSKHLVTLAETLMNQADDTKNGKTLRHRALFLYENALPVYERSLVHDKQTITPSDGLLLRSYEVLGNFYLTQGAQGNPYGYQRAELYFKEALAQLKAPKQAAEAARVKETLRQIDKMDEAWKHGKEKT